MAVHNRFQKIIASCLQLRASDLHLSGGHKVAIRKSGKISFVSVKGFSPQEMDQLVEGLLSSRQLEVLRSKWAVDFSMSMQGVRLRINVFTTWRGLSMAVRFLPGVIPSVQELNLTPELASFTQIPSGLVLVCGTTGSGKSTTIASLLREINENRPCHIITLEDPVEYRFQSKTAFVEQRELGTHVPSFEQGLMDVLREDPDVIMVGELREPETIRLALNASVSGHLVIASLHAGTPEEAVFRICNSFSNDSQEFVHRQLAMCLGGIVVQRLVYREGLGFMVPSLSIVRPSTAVRGVIADNKVAQLSNIVEMGRREGMYSFEMYEKEFVDRVERFYTPEEVLRSSPEQVQGEEYVSKLIGGAGGAVEVPEIVGVGHREPVYSLDESESVDDVISKLERRNAWLE